MVWNLPLGEKLPHKKSLLFLRQDFTWQLRLASNSLITDRCLALSVHFLDASEFQTRVLWVLNLCKYLKAEDSEKRILSFCAIKGGVHTVLFLVSLVKEKNVLKMEENVLKFLAAGVYISGSKPDFYMYCPLQTKSDRTVSN